MQQGSKICISGRWRKSSIPGRAEKNTSIGWPRGGVDPKVHNEYLGTCKKLDRETALGKARRIKAKDLGINKRSGPE